MWNLLYWFLGPPPIAPNPVPATIADIGVFIDFFSKKRFRTI